MPLNSFLQKLKSDKKTITIAIIVVALIVVAGIYFLTRKKKQAPMPLSPVQQKMLEQTQALENLRVQRRKAGLEPKPITSNQIKSDMKILIELRKQLSQKTAATKKTP